MTKAVLRRARAALLAGGALAVTALAAPAQAADMRLPPPPVLEGYGEVVELGSGWYLRGDIGYLKPVDPKVSVVSAGLGVTRDYLSEKLDPSFSLGIGGGYKFTNWFRADLTLDYRFPGDFSGSLSGFPQQAKLDGWVGLANGYLDLGSWYGLSPYIGAGIGIAQTNVEDYLDNGLLAGTRSDDWTLAFALMGGIAVDLGEGFMLDFGYRYLNVSDADIQLTAFDQVRFKDLQSHEFRFGVRYMIDGK